MTILEIASLCVEPFPLSAVRKDIMAGFETLYEQALAVKLHGFIWLDGSFLTRKIEPHDVDLIFVVPAELYDSGTSEQFEFLEWLIDKEDEPKTSFMCHTDVVLSYKEGHAEYERYLANLHHWEANVYGFSVNTKEPKGIVVVELEERLP